MFIKQIIIQGFKSYKDQTVIDPFSPHHNVVVGRNGSGKSNFFAAIRFVLSDAYSNMSREERQALLHESTGPTTMSAYVEILFDNSDHRFPTGRDEVILRRTIGMKKDDYSLDRKSVPFVSKLVALINNGFSRSNPFYIVPQGRITSLCNAKDNERLQVLKEVAGTRVYEQRRVESLKIMNETEIKRDKIKDLLKYIEQRLSELDEEKEELKLFNELDRDRRTMEYTIYQRELIDVNEQIDKLDEERQIQVDSLHQLRHTMHNKDQMVNELQLELEQSKKTLQLHNQERQMLMEENDESIKEIARLEMTLTDGERTRASASKERDHLLKESKELATTVAQKESELSELTQEFQQLHEQETRIRTKLNEKKQQLHLLEEKRSRIQRFSNPKERQSFLKKEISALKSNRAEQEKQLTTLKKELTDMREHLKSNATAMAGIEKIMETLHTSAGGEIRDMKQRLNELNQSRKELWRAEAQQDAFLATTKEELRRTARQLSSMIDQDTNAGIETVKKIAARLNLEGVFGALYELFECDETFSTAVEMTAGASLFHVVVDTDETASKILELLNAERGGRVTFMPLNRLRPKHVDYPNNKDAIPLIKKLRYDPKFDVAFKQVFCKTIVCPSLEIASSYAKSSDLNGITLDGDRVERKGVMVGGYHDLKRSKMECIRKLRKLKTDVIKAEEQSATTKLELQSIEKEITQSQSKAQLMEAEVRRNRSRRELLEKELAGLRQDSKRVEVRLQSSKHSEETLQENLKLVIQQTEALEADSVAPFKTGLTDEEIQQLDVLQKEVYNFQKQFSKASSNSLQVRAKQRQLENELNANLRKRYDEIMSELRSLEQDESFETEGVATLDQTKHELEFIQKQSEQNHSRIQYLDAHIEELNVNISDVSDRIEKTQTQQNKESRQIDQHLRAADKYLAHRNVLDQKRAEVTEKLRSLGIVSEDAFAEFNESNTTAIMKKLHKVNEKLKKYQHVNKKAFEQYSNFAKQRDSLLERQKEVDKSATSIKDLIKVLDQRKNEAINRTFAEVRKHFEEVFEKLVPAGKGQLTMIMADRDSESTDQDSMDVDGEDKTPTEEYVGVSIKLSFNSKSDEGLLMQQLSGGQKSLVALALIFAIQRCDPAPFYLFDEIDANLDAAYRTSVATMIHELSESAQFITTTFRPEMLIHANKFYGVTFRNRVSHVDVITKEDALTFVDQEAH